MADDPELTDGDYPTDDTLQRIAAASPREALLLAERAWHWDGWATRELRKDERGIVAADDEDRTEYIRFATGGWSGNESIIAALRENVMVSALCWQMTARGGLHIYELPPSVDAVDPSAASTGTPTTREKHVCGLSGYNGMIDPPCPACEANHDRAAIRTEHTHD